MKQIPTVNAEGHVLCHDITRIVRNVKKDVAFRKGHKITREDIPVLLALGKQHIYVWEYVEGMLHENEAAEILYHICAGAYMHPTPVKEGKIEVIAGADGLLRVNVDKLREINLLGDIVIATRHTHSPVKQGDCLAGTRIIPLIILKEKMDTAKAIAGEAPILTLFPYHHKKVGIITTGSEVREGLIQDTFTPVLREKLNYFGAEVMENIITGDDAGVITAAIQSFIEQGAELILCSGGMSVDPDDRTPLAIRETGARVVSYGSPVLPGAMFMLAYTNKGIPIMGLPGCVMYAGRTVFDLILPRVMADVPVEAAELAALGHGGLCLNCAACVFPNCGFGAGV